LPPIDPRVTGQPKASIFSLVFRPEFLRLYMRDTPLSPDALSAWSHSEDQRQHNDQVMAATVLLLDTVVPEAHKAFSERDADQVQASELRDFFHNRGLNMIFLGKFYQLCDPRFRHKKVVLSEMVARVAKQELRRRMRAVQATNSESVYRAIVIDFLAEVRKPNTSFWQRDVSQLLLNKYQIEFKQPPTENDLFCRW